MQKPLMFTPYRVLSKQQDRISKHARLINISFMHRMHLYLYLYRNLGEYETDTIITGFANVFMKQKLSQKFFRKKLIQSLVC